MIDKRIGRRIRQRREALGLTQEQLAEKIGLTPNYISTLELLIQNHSQMHSP